MGTLLSMRGISKRFGAVEALRQVDIDVEEGSVHALIGENGAGKSTLMKVLSGAIAPDCGTMLFGGAPLRNISPQSARRHGIAMIYQELTLAPHLTVAGNVSLGAEQSRWGIVRREAMGLCEALQTLGHEEIAPDAPVGRLSIAQRQIAEIARALCHKARLIVMDEPTSSLPAQDAAALFAAIKRLQRTGVTIIYISHFLEELREIADCYTVLRDGRSVGSGLMSPGALQEVVRLMVGRSVTEMFPKVNHAIGEPMLRISGLSLRPRVQESSLSLRAGEILGIGGLVGAGRTSLLRGIYGLDKADSGLIWTRNGFQIQASRNSPRRSLSAGIALLSENRRDEGLALSMSVRENATLSALDRFARPRALGLLSACRELRAVAAVCRQLSIRCRSVQQRVLTLSGGNQQKVALARMLLNQSNVLLLDEPARGIDVASKAEIYRRIGELAAAGKAIIMASSYLPELLGISDTIAVMYRGRLSPILPRDRWTEERIMACATSGRAEA
jgi:ribose transport system ATP-binding protein